MSAGLIAALFCVLVFLASVVGGLIPLYVRPTHRRMQIALSFVAGVMLGIGVFNLMPHGFYALHNIEQVALWIMAGFLAMFFLERVFSSHTHESPEELLATANVCDSHQGGHHHHSHGASHAKLAWGGATFGLAIHSVVDGFALAAGIQLGWQVGLGLLFAVMLHKPFDALTVGLLMSASNQPVAKRQLVNILFAMVTPLGVAIFFFGYGHIEESNPQLLGIALSFSAGAFLCIAASDLLPEVRFHSHDRLKLSAALLLGISLAWAIEHFTHDHSRHAPVNNGSIEPQNGHHRH